MTPAEFFKKDFPKHEQCSLDIKYPCPYVSNKLIIDKAYSYWIGHNEKIQCKLINCKYFKKDEREDIPTNDF